MSENEWEVKKEEKPPSAMALSSSKYLYNEFIREL